MKKEKKMLIIVNCSAFIFSVLFIIFAKAAINMGIYECTFFKTFHLYCPGCGGTRALFSLLRLDFFSSLRYNPTLLFGVFVYIYYDICAAVAIKKRNTEYFKKSKYILLIIYAFFIIVNFIIRNILLIKYGVDLIGDVMLTY